MKKTLRLIGGLLLIGAIFTGCYYFNQIAVSVIITYLFVKEIVKNG
jgi:hypothetical protein